MASPDLDAPARVSHLSAAKSPSGSVRSGVRFLLIFSLAFAGAWQGRAQEQTEQSQDQFPSQTPDQNSSVAEAARQERARKQSQQRKTGHVYTAEDLKREHILNSKDRAGLETRKNRQPATPAGPQKLEDGALGDIARRVRGEKESQQLQRSEQFPLPFADAPVLASPRPPVEPLLPSVTMAPPTAVVPAPREVARWRPFVKRSPFERPSVLPAPPVVPRRFAPRPPALSPPPHTPGIRATRPPERVPVSPIISGKLTIVTVKPGDSLWKFAASRLGDGHRWRELLTLNPGLPSPDLLEVGSQIVVPASFAPPPARTKYTVRNGDTLWTIAQAQFSHGTAWSCIVDANADLDDANVIHEGQVLLLPASCLP